MVQFRLQGERGFYNMVVPVPAGSVFSDALVKVTYKAVMKHHVAVALANISWLSFLERVFVFPCGLVLDAKDAKTVDLRLQFNDAKLQTTGLSEMVIVRRGLCSRHYAN